MENELVIANKDSVKVLGLQVDCLPKELHIFIDGVDITKVTKYSEIRVVSIKENLVK